MSSPRGRIAIRASGLGKSYVADGSALGWLRRHIANAPAGTSDIAAVRNIDLEIERGEAVGIVGRNGSGKSTLLSMIAGVTTPSTGTCAVAGKIAPLLELGSGFHPEFTGRENVALNASILGLTAGEIAASVEDIYAFANIGDFIDRPMRTYSTGMQARLAFAVAIHVNADILIVDEALSVGDEVFQRKCFARLKKFRNDGGTVLFVSHAAQTVIDLCTRAVLLDGGERLLTGEPNMVVGQYQRLASAPAEVRKGILDHIRMIDRGETQSGMRDDTILSGFALDDAGADLEPSSPIHYHENGARIGNVRIHSEGGAPVSQLQRGEVYVLRYEVGFSRAARNVRCAMMIKTVTGQQIGGLLSHPAPDGLKDIKEGQRVSAAFRFRAGLNPGVFFSNVGVVADNDGETVFLHRIIDALAFRVLPVAGSTSNGPVDLAPDDNAPPCTLTLEDASG